MVRESNCRDGEPNPPSERRLLSRAERALAHGGPTHLRALTRGRRSSRRASRMVGRAASRRAASPTKGTCEPIRPHEGERRLAIARVSALACGARNLFLHACRVQSPADLVFGPCATVPARGDRGRSTRPAVRAGRHPAPARPSPHCLAAPARQRALPHPLEKDYGGFHPAISWDRERNSWRIFTPLTLPSPRRGEGAADSYSFRGP